jgi:hypothetical protein
MIKKIYGINDKNEKIELAYKEFLLITDNDSELEINFDTEKHLEKPDLALHIPCGPLTPAPDQPETFTSTKGHRYFNILPGASNLIFIKVVHK